MADGRTEGVIVHLVDKHGEGEIEREYDDWEIVDEGRLADLARSPHPQGATEVSE